jgi:hypothetical protein
MEHLSVIAAEFWSMQSEQVHSPSTLGACGTGRENGVDVEVEVGVEVEADGADGADVGRGGRGISQIWHLSMTEPGFVKPQSEQFQAPGAGWGFFHPGEPVCVTPWFAGLTGLSSAPGSDLLNSYVGAARSIASALAAAVESSRDGLGTDGRVKV